MSQKGIPSRGNGRERRGSVRGQLPDVRPSQGMGVSGKGRAWKSADVFKLGNELFR